MSNVQLLERGARVEALDAQGFTPLLVACRAGNVSPIQSPSRHAVPFEGCFRAFLEIFVNYWDFLVTFGNYYALQ